MKCGASPSLCQSRIEPSAGRDENHLDNSAGLASNSRFKVSSGASPAVASNFVRRQLERSTPALPSTLVALGFGKDFSLLGTDFGRFRVSDRAQPTCKCYACEAVNAAVAALRQAAALPCLDVNRPPLTPGFVLDMFRTLRRFSNAAENPIWNTGHFGKVVQEPRTLTMGRRMALQIWLRETGARV